MVCFIFRAFMGRYAGELNVCRAWSAGLRVNTSHRWGKLLSESPSGRLAEHHQEKRRAQRTDAAAAPPRAWFDGIGQGTVCRSDREDAE